MAHPPTANLDSAIEAYEAARERDPGADLDLTQFTLPRPHPDYAPAIVELVRVDMEHTWHPADDSRVDRYRALFPDALSGEDAVPYSSRPPAFSSSSSNFRSFAESSTPRLTSTGSTAFSSPQSRRH